MRIWAFWQLLILSELCGKVSNKVLLAQSLLVLRQSFAKWLAAWEAARNSSISRNRTTKVELMCEDKWFQALCIETWVIKYEDSANLWGHLQLSEEHFAAHPHQELRKGVQAWHYWKVIRLVEILISVNNVIHFQVDSWEQEDRSTFEK